MSEPIIVAHRGASHAEPEHTREAYELAIAEGADAFECDVRLTRDGHLVLVHDARIDRTSTGRGSVSAMTLAELAEHRYSPSRDDSDFRLLTLPEFIRIADSAPRSIGLSIETKHPTRDSHRLEDAVIDLLARVGRLGEDTTRVMSFSRAALHRARRRSDQVPLVYLFDAPSGEGESGALPPGVQIAGPSIAYVRDNPDYVRRVHERGHRVHVWTVDDPADVEICVTIGVDALITNRPGAVKQLLGHTT